MSTTQTPRILGTPPEPYDGNAYRATAFLNVLENFFTINAATFDTSAKKVAAALTYFKQGTRGGDWASDVIAEALPMNNYRSWTNFKAAFKAQFVPPETQVEAIQKVHTTPQKNREFKEWYQEWSTYARRANIDEATKIYAFQSALNQALHNKILQLSPMPTTLTTLVEKAQEFDKNWRTFAGPQQGFHCSGNNARIQEISEDDTEINATTSSRGSSNRGRGQGRGRGHGRLTPKERKHRWDNNLCMYCRNAGHHALQCTEPPNRKPGYKFGNINNNKVLVRKIESVPEEEMEKLTLDDESGINVASANYFEPLVKFDIDDQQSFMDTL